MPREYLTPEEAIEVELSINPFKRRQQIIGHLAAFGIYNKQPLILRRRSLVWAAEAAEELDLLDVEIFPAGEEK
jgi:hypothetical protein